MIRSKSSLNLVYKDFSTSAIGTTIFQSTSDPMSIGNIMMHNELIYINSEFDIPVKEEYYEPPVYKGYEFDYELEKILNKFDLALRDLAEL